MPQRQATLQQLAMPHQQQRLQVRLSKDRQSPNIIITSIWYCDGIRTYDQNIFRPNTILIAAVRYE